MNSQTRHGQRQSCVPGVRPRLSRATEPRPGLPENGGSPPPSCLLCLSHSQPPSNRPPLSKGALYNTARVTAVGTEATERDCLQLIDLCELLTEGCAQSPRKIRGGGIPGREVGGNLPWLSPPACCAVPQQTPCLASVSLLQGKEKERDKQEGKKE